MHSLSECCSSVTFEQVFWRDSLNGGDVSDLAVIHSYSNRRRDLLIEIFLSGFRICYVTIIFLINYF